MGRKMRARRGHIWGFEVEVLQRYWPKDSQRPRWEAEKGSEGSERKRSAQSLLKGPWVAPK